MSNSLINLGELSKPATTFVEKICNATGIIFEPWLEKRRAKAQVEVEKIKRLGKIENDKLAERALTRFVQEESNKQENIEKITRKAIGGLNDNSNPNDIENDRITYFFDRCRLVSDNEMQNLRAKILSGEANQPGHFSKRTISFIETLDKKDAQTFNKLCGYNCSVSDRTTPLVYDSSNEIYTKNGINFESLNHLQSIGLISFNTSNSYQIIKLNKSDLITYFGKKYTVEFENNTGNIEIGKVLFTNVGNELAKICSPKIVEGFEDYFLGLITSKNIQINKIL